MIIGDVQQTAPIISSGFRSSLSILPRNATKSDRISIYTHVPPANGLFPFCIARSFNTSLVTRGANQPVLSFNISLPKPADIYATNLQG